MNTIVASAPGRAGIVGNPSDMYGGCVISCSTAERAYCALTEDDRLVLEALGEEQEIVCPGDLEPQRNRLDIAKAVVKWFDVDTGSARFRLSTWTDIPENAGLAGSTALLICVFACVAEKLGVRFKPHELAENARKVEAEVLGITCGYQDQYMGVFGGLNYMDFRGKENLGQAGPEPYATVESLIDAVSETPFVVAHTGVKRHSGQVHRSMRERWLDREAEVVQGYEDVASLARTAKKALIAERWEELGRLMNDNHAIQQKLGASGDVNDRLIEIARENGALGAKLAGAGHGGTIVALTFDPDATMGSLREAGAERILRPRPVTGLIVERTDKAPIGLGELAGVSH